VTFSFQRGSEYDKVSANFRTHEGQALPSGLKEEGSELSKQIAIVAAWAGPIPDIVRAVRKNHEAFAAKHGYEYLFYDDSTLKPIQALVRGEGDLHWIKPDVILSALENHEFVFWTDLDSVFHDLGKSLDDLVRKGKDFVFTGDHNDLFNGGHLFFRRGEFSHRLISEWSSLQSIPFPTWASGSQQGPSGHVGDQVAMNFLLAGGHSNETDVWDNGLRLLNLTNGWLGNPNRTRKRFHKTHAPVSIANLRRSRRLLSPRIRASVEIVPQYRLNAYPWWGPKGQGNRRGPIVHFVPPYKGLLQKYFDETSPPL